MGSARRSVGVQREEAIGGVTGCPFGICGNLRRDEGAWGRKIAREELPGQ